MYDTGFNKPDHLCKVYDFCIVNETTKILFCVFCKKVVGMMEGEDMKLMRSVYEQVTDKKKDEYDDELIESLK